MYVTVSVSCMNEGVIIVFKLAPSVELIDCDAVRFKLAPDFAEDKEPLAPATVHASVPAPLLTLKLTSPASVICLILFDVVKAFRVRSVVVALVIEFKVVVELEKLTTPAMFWSTPFVLFEKVVVFAADWYTTVPALPPVKDADKVDPAVIFPTPSVVRNGALIIWSR